jgi:methanogenic corrinoid protein MtbC1
MIRWCSYCQRYLGEAPPFDDYAMTHGICDACFVSLDGGASFRGAERLVDYYGRLNLAGQGGQLPSAAAVLDEGIALGLRPVDLLMGLVQPALYQVGESWSSGKITVASEHAFTAMASALLALVTYKYPDAHAYRQSCQPRVLLIAAEGNYHTLGLQLVELMLVLERIPTFTVYPGIPAAEAVQLWRAMRPPVVGFSLAEAGQLGQVREAADAILSDASPPRLVVGGFPVREGLPAPHHAGIELLADPLALVESLRPAAQSGVNDSR